MHPNNLKQELALAFITGGNAIFTIMSNKTKQRFTYKVKKMPNIDNVLVVLTLVGPDNVNNYKKIGELYTGETSFLSSPSLYLRNHPEYIALDFVINNLVDCKYMPSLEIWHEGRCCKCGRTLTVPESIESGIGPECKLKS